MRNIIRHKKIKNRIIMTTCFMLVAGSASAGWLYNVDFGRHPNLEPGSVYEGEAILGLTSDDYWNWRGYGNEEHQQLLSDESETDYTYFNSGSSVTICDDNTNLLLRDGRHGESDDWIWYNAVNLPANTQMRLVVYSGGDGTGDDATQIRVVDTTEGMVSVTSTGTNSSDFIEGENYWVFDVESTIDGAVRIAIKPVKSYDEGGRSVISGMQLTPIPEPATLAMFGLGGLFLLWKCKYS